MISWMDTAALRRLTALIVSVSLAACGGGGGSSGDPVLGGGSPPSGGGGGGTSTPIASMTVSLSSTTVTVASPATVTVKVVNRAGTALPGQVVEFSSTLGLGKFSAPSALTDANGLAAVQVSPATSTATGADTVTARTTVSGTEITAGTGFQLTATNVTLTSFTSDLGTSPLSAYGQTGLTVVLGNATAGNPVNVVLTSSCVTQGKATLTPAAVTTSTGRAVFTYRDNGCGALASTDAIQASVTGTSLTSSLSLSLTQPTVSSIAFISSTPDTIYLKGSGYVENANVKFRVVDANGNGVPQQQVSFEPTTLAGGLLVDGSSAPASKVTDSNGEVIVRINSGTVPTPVRVRATLVGSNISTVSSNLSIAVGLPSQLNYSLSQGTINIEGYDYDGTPNTYTIIASDRLGNPVPEGTSMNFVAEGGQIQAVRQSAVSNGLSTTTANFLSSEPRPRDGRITIVSYALGEESFLDRDGDNVYTTAGPLGPEDYQDLGAIFIDRLFNFGGRDPSAFNTARFDPSKGYNLDEDQVISLGNTGNSTCASSVSALLDLDRSIPVKPGTCVPGWGSAYVRRATETILSRSTSRILFGESTQGILTSYQADTQAGCPSAKSLIRYYDETDQAQARTYYPLEGSGAFVGTGTEGAFSLTVADSNPVAYNPMPAGTVVTVAATSGLAATVLSGSPVPSTREPTGVRVSFKFDDTTQAGSITVTTTTPKGVVSSASVGLKRAAPQTAGVACP